MKSFCVFDDGLSQEFTLQTFGACRLGSKRSWDFRKTAEPRIAAPWASAKSWNSRKTECRPSLSTRNSVFVVDDYPPKSLGHETAIEGAPAFDTGLFASGEALPCGHGRFRQTLFFCTNPGISSE